VQAVCVLGYGFFPRDLAQLIPRADPDLISEVLLSLTKEGFLDFIHMA
jgi:hypothetical protein